MLRAISICTEVIAHMVKTFSVSWGDRYVLDRINSMKSLSSAFAKYGGLLGKIAQILCVDVEESDVFDNCTPQNSAESTEYVLTTLAESYEDRLVIDPEVYKSGSLGQVYKGVLDGTTDVILKVQYRGIMETFEQDFEVIGFLMKYICSMENMVEAIDDAKEMSQRELDYLNEMKSQKEVIEIFEDNPNIHVPSIYSELCTNESLVMEYMTDFTSLKEFMKTATTEEKSLVGNHIFEFVMGLLIGRGMYYSDSHYGNYLVNDKNEICVLDFGCISQFSEERIQSLKGMIKAGIDEDKEGLTEIYMKMGVLTEDMEADVVDYAYTMNELVTRPFRVPNFKFTPEYVTEVASTETDILRQWKLPRGLVYLQKIPWSLYAMLARLEVTLTCVDGIMEKYM